MMYTIDLMSVMRQQIRSLFLMRWMSKRRKTIGGSSVCRGTVGGRFFVVSWNRIFQNVVHQLETDGIDIS
jgi:hypothetical protein